MVMSAIGRVDTDPADSLEAAAAILERAVLDAPITQAERSYLGGTASRLRALAGRLRDEEAGTEEEPSPPRRPARYYSRKEAAALIGVVPNTLLNWEARGYLSPVRDARGWRVYDRDALARAMARAAGLEVSDRDRPARR